MIDAPQENNGFSFLPDRFYLIETHLIHTGLPITILFPESDRSPVIEFLLKITISSLF